MAVKTFDPGEVMVIVGGVIVSGYAPGAFVRVEYEVDAFTKKVGADGETTRIKSRNKSARMTLTLLRSSASNTALMAIRAADDAANAGVVPVAVKDNLGETTFFSASGWIVRTPNWEAGEDAPDVEWMIDCADVAGFVGGLDETESA